MAERGGGDGTAGARLGFGMRLLGKDMERGGCGLHCWQGSRERGMRPYKEEAQGACLGAEGLRFRFFLVLDRTRKRQRGF